MECEFKEVADTMSFTAYGNVKNVVDHVGDVAVDGCYKNSIERHAKKGTTPRLLWGHDAYSPPVGKISHLEEDSKGLLFSGKLSKTDRGNEIYVLAKDKAIDSFSIGYRVIEEEMDANNRVNLLKEIDILEISFVNFACNEDSLLQDIKSHITSGEVPTTREMEKLLRAVGFSRKEAIITASYYKPLSKDTLDIEALKSHPFFKR